MNLVIETDIGHDPDDVFAILYLIAAGVNIRAITIVPGDLDQIAMAKFICAECGLDIPIGASKPDRDRRSSGSIHHEILNKYNYPLDGKADGLGVDILENVLSTYPDSELFVIGPVTSIGKYYKKHTNEPCRRATMQGGFLPYSYYKPDDYVLDFENKAWMPTFNLNGDRNGAEVFLSANIQRQMVGKNVCHTVIFDESKYKSLGVNDHRAFSLFEEMTNTYLGYHNSKKFHDPTAAVCHLHPEVGMWMNGKTTKMDAGWGTVPDGGDLILKDINRTLLWDYLLNGK